MYPSTHWHPLNIAINFQGSCYYIMGTVHYFVSINYICICIIMMCVCVCRQSLLRLVWWIGLVHIIVTSLSVFFGCEVEFVAVWKGNHVGCHLSSGICTRNTYVHDEIMIIEYCILTYTVDQETIICKIFTEFYYSFLEHTD